MDLGLAAVFGAGVLTLLTPCVLPMLPVYLGMLLGAGVESAQGKSRLRLLTLTAFFVFGFTAIFTLLGLAASAVGSALQEHRAALLLGGGLIITVLGLKSLGVLRLSVLDGTLQIERRMRASSPIGALVFGVVFALGWTPCVGPILGSVLTYTASQTSSPALGALYLSVYGLGVGLPLLGLSAGADTLLPRLRELRRHLPVLERVTGAVLVLAGLSLVFPGVALAAGSIRNVWRQSPSGEPLQDPSETTGVTREGAPLVPPLGTPSPRPRLVEFYRPDCTVCERMRPHLEQLRRDCLSHQVEILEVDLTDPRNHALVERMRIRAVPSVTLFDDAGAQRAKLVGERTLAELRGAAASLMNATCAGERALNDFSPSDLACSGVEPAASEAGDPKPASAQPCGAE